MSHTSPSTYLVWSIVSVLLSCFLVFHLWSFDRFRCLKWSNNSGAFKRIMTYSLLATLPLELAYAVGFCAIKYQEGFVILPGIGTFPKPYELWEDAHRKALFPLMLLFSIAWSLEMVTHLEELCFWFFLVKSKSGQQNWFRTHYFKAWVVGSIGAVLYMPLITIFSRSDPLKCEAYLFLSGSVIDLAMVLCFIPILWMFPIFLDHLRHQGVDISAVVRLTTFHELNCIRVIFRLLFVCPLAILGIDGVRPHTHINESLFWTDFLTILAAFGVAVSSGITVVIFFPRSIEGEIAAKQVSRKRGFRASMLTRSNYSQSTIDLQSQSQPTYLLTSSPVTRAASLRHERNGSTHPPPSYYSDDHGDDGKIARLTPLRPNRRNGGDIELGSMEPVPEGTNLLDTNSSTQLRPSVNPMVANFTSPIDLASGATPIRVENNQSRLTFNRNRRGAV